MLGASDNAAMKSDFREAPPWAESEAAIARRFASGAMAGMPIYLQVQNAIIHLVREQVLPTNSQLPPDHRLTTLLGISLGTVQKALSNLASLGWVRREHGRGTFVAGPRQPLAGSWHFRFRDPKTDEVLPVFSKLLGRQMVESTLALRRELGEDPAGYLMIERLFDIGGRFACHGRLYLGAGRFGRLLDYPRAQLEDINLKEIFAEDFDSPTLSVRERVRAITLDAEIAGYLGESVGAAAMRIDILAFTTGSAPLSFQQIHIPVTTCPLEITPLRAPG